MQFLVTAGGLITFSFDRHDKQLLRSSIPFSIGKSTNGSLQVSVKANLYLKEDKIRVTGELWHKDMPDNYYGVGYEAAHDTPKSDSTTAYHRDWKRIYAKVVYQYKPKYFIGGIFDATGTDATDLNPLMQKDPNVISNGTQVNTRGLGVVMEYDSRDVPVDAYTGVFLDLSVINYGRAWGSTDEFWTVDMDYRQYAPVGHRHTVAWEVRARTNFGDVPWTEMSQIGTPWDLRGYVWGQYRDELMTYAMGEYRHMFNRKTANKRGSLESRWGFATWLGMGAVAEDIASIPAVLPNAGVGIRFETEKRSNIRVDYGVGTKSSAFYVTFYEAF
jgi:outer membrane protein assembly factor BamA